MKRHRNPRARLPKRPTPDNRHAGSPAPPLLTFDLHGALAVLRDDLGRADTMLVTADELIVQVWSGEGEGGPGDTLTRRRNHVSYLMEAARLAVRAAMRTSDEIDLHRGDV